MSDKVLELINKIRFAPSSEERREIALQLASIKEDEAHDELYRMADGEIIYTPRTWKRLWLRKAITEYGLEDQLIAIEALAETGTEKALNFLRNIKKSKSYLSGSEREWGPYHEMFGHGGGRIYYNAKGVLRTALYNDDFEVHRRVENAIKRIEETYKNNQNKRTDEDVLQKEVR